MKRTFNYGFAYLSLALLPLIAGCSAQRKLDAMSQLSPCLPTGEVLGIQTEQEIPPAALQMFPQVVKFPLDAIPEAKAVGLKGNVQFSLPALQHLGAVCQEYERIKAEK